MNEERVDIAIIGAGAAGLMGAVFAGRAAQETGRPLKILALDGAKKLGAKILVAGGGRCNVTHYKVDADQYAGSSTNAIKKVLRRFGAAQTKAFFADLGVELKREDTGKMFPVTNKAQTVLDALLGEVRVADVELRHPWRVASLGRDEDGRFVITRQHTDDKGRYIQTDEPDTITAERVILATGGKALPRTGSDGAGYAFAKAMGHTITDRVFPSLVPILLGEQAKHITDLSGIASVATLEVRSGTGKKLKEFTNSTLCTHFGLSGPGPLDISRYFFDAQHHDPDAALVINWLPGESFESVDKLLLGLGKRSVHHWLKQERGFPERLVRMLCDQAKIDPGAPASTLTRDQRRELVRVLTDMVLPVTGDRGFTYAEVTAGGVPLDEINLKTMESRVCPGLHLIGEICDVDGRIGGFNFQWAWASGYIAGSAAGK
ncbi:MAG: NAD(P)/FAD-dependent oxidoreductase [Phycisphaerales bacterium JB050]